jgi:hypothetical protein
MDTGDDESNGGGGMMMMVMTFGSWSDYQLKLLFEGWDITTKGQFALSWFAVVAATAAYQGIKFWLITYETKMLHRLSKRSSSGNSTEEGRKLEVESSVFANGGSLADALVDSSSAINLSLKERVVHAVVSAINYGFALLLMLVAMTYNPSLFLALVVGYGAGDMIFYNRTFSRRVSEAYTGVPLGEKECH